MPSPSSPRHSRAAPTMLTSRDNPRVKRWMSLLDRKGSQRQGQCVVSGAKLVADVLTHAPTRCREVLYTKGMAMLPATPRHVSAIQLSPPLFRQLDTAGTASPLLVCETSTLETANLAQAARGLEVLCPLGDPGNVGTVIRSCHAFGVRRLILLAEAAYPFHPRALRASSGTALWQPMAWGPSIHDLASRGVGTRVTALSPQGTDLSQWSWPLNVRLLVGEEGLGVPPVPIRQRLAIPQVTTIDSLNAAVALSIALFAYRQDYPLPNDGPQETPS